MEPTPRDRRPDGDPPFGLPVLAEVPELAAMLEQLVEVDRLLARAVEALIMLQDHHVAESATGVALDQWLAAVGRRTFSDRRMLTTAAGVCRRLPALRAAFAAGTVSWAQVRAVALKIERLPRHLDDRLDGVVADTIAGAADADPDALGRAISWALDGLDPGERHERTAPDRDLLVLQPRLDGSGGTLFGDFGPEGFAILDAATDPGTPPAGVKDGIGQAADPARAEMVRTGAGHARARKLIDRCRHHCDSDGSGGGRPAPVRLLLRAELDTLLEVTNRTGRLLTTLTGGTMRIDAATTRRLADLFGADVRLIVTDRGRPVGVGRLRRQPPGWLRDLVLAVHDTCSEPGCATAARVCDLDHAMPWQAGGPTDAGNLAPLCATANHTKEPGGWQATQTTDGARTWHHPRSGLTVRTLPATWRPPPRPDRGPPGRGARAPTRTRHSPLEQRLHHLVASHRTDDDLPF